MKKWWLVCIRFKSVDGEFVHYTKVMPVGTNSPDEVIVPENTVFFFFVDKSSFSKEELNEELVIFKFRGSMVLPNFMKAYKVYAIGEEVIMENERFVYNENIECMTKLADNMTVVDI